MSHSGGKQKDQKDQKEHQKGPLSKEQKDQRGLNPVPLTTLNPVPFFFFVLLSSLELSDTTIYEP